MPYLQGGRSRLRGPNSQDPTRRESGDYEVFLLPPVETAESVSRSWLLYTVENLTLEE